VSLHEDELEPLPPLDGDPSDKSDNGDNPEGEADFGDLLDEASEQATLDDATGEEEPADTSGIDLADGESGWLGEAGEAADLDLTGLDIAMIDFGKEAVHVDESDEPTAAEEDFGFGDAPERGGLDAAEDGPLDPDEELREADLPALDADEEGEMDDAALLDVAFGLDEPLGLPWAAAPWPRVGSPVTLAGAAAVACASRGALVAGRSEGAAPGVFRVDLEGTCERLQVEAFDAVAVCALSVDGHRIAAVLEGGRLLVSHDAGRSFGPVAEPVAASDVVFASGRLWVRTRTGALVVAATDSTDPTRADIPMDGGGKPTREQPAIERCPIPGIAVAIAADGAGVGVLVVDDAGQPNALVRATAGASTTRQAIDGPAAHSPAPFAVRGGHVAYAPRRGGVVRRTGSAPWASFAWEGQVTALAFVDDTGTMIAATYSDVDDTTALVRVDPAGNASVVARIGAAHADAESDGRVVSVAHDQARGVVWVVGAFGVAAFATR
jgi:hypothetical protein